MGYKIFNRYKDEGLEALIDRTRRPVRPVTRMSGSAHLREPTGIWGATGVLSALGEDIA